MWRAGRSCQINGAYNIGACVGCGVVGRVLLEVTGACAGVQERVGSPWVVWGPAGSDDVGGGWGSPGGLRGRFGPGGAVEGGQDGGCLGVCFGDLAVGVAPPGDAAAGPQV